MRKICTILIGAGQHDDERARSSIFMTAKLLPIDPHPRLAEFDENLTNSRRFHILVIDLRAGGGKVRKIYAPLRNPTPRAPRL
jgi:hypothetical protein